MATYYNPIDSSQVQFVVEDETTECTVGQTLCQNNISYVCSGGSWVEGGSSCSSGCTSGATKCEGGYWWTCENGVWTLTNIPCNQTPTKNYMPYLILGGIGVMAIAGIALIARRP